MRWTVVGLAAVSAMALVASVLIAPLNVNTTLIYFLVPFAIAFPLARMLPWRGRVSLVVTLLLGAACWLVMWWGGLGIGVALILARLLPRGGDASVASA